MKRILAFVCMLSIVLSLGILPASAAAGDSMTLQYVSLRTTEDKEGIYFGANFTLTQNTIDNMECYGIALTPRQLDDWAANMGSKIQYSKYTGGLTAGKTTYVRSTSLVNILNISNDNLTNNNNAATTIYVKPYVKLSDGSYIFGEGGQISMKQVAKLIDLEYATLNDTQKMGLLGMYERFTNVMKGWGLTNLKKHYTSGGYVTVTNENGEEEQISLILQYRRNKVVANMQAQADLLWSFTGSEPVKYSRAPSSAGYDADKQSNVYTLYPGRIYKGIPYTHASAGMDIYSAMGEQENGVWVIDGLNSSFLNGGSNNADAYNTARMGNDCWDAISWAYESIGSSVSADQTNEVTPDFGMYPLLKANGEPAFEIEHFLGAAGSDGKRRLTYMDDSYVTYYKDNAANRQVIYEAYTLMQMGDTLVHYVHDAGGHALMAISVSVKRNNDGTINPDQSSVVFIEQGSSHEKAQSVDFDVANLTNQYLAHSGGHNDQGIIKDPGDPKTCKQCAEEAGYDKATGIWTLNPGQISRTFTELFDEGYYIPMTSEELRNPTAKIPATRLSDSVSKPSSVLNIYNGKIDSTYRISQIRLDIFNNAGAKINTATCFGVQNGLNAPFNLSRFVYDQTIGAYGSVIAGTPAIKYMSATFPVLDEQGNQTYTYKESASGTYYKDAEGNYVEVPAEGVPEGTTLYTRTAATKTYNWLEAPDLEVGFYSFTMTCKLGNGAVKTIRSGYFQVAEGKDPHGNTVHLVGEE